LRSRKEFQNATEQEALGMANARFTPYQDVMAMATKLAKDAGLSIKTDAVQGGYIVTTKNGPQLIGPLSNLFAGSIGKDPKVMEYYRTKAYVDRKNWIRGNASVYDSEDAAEAAYFNNMTAAMDQYLGGGVQSLELEREVLSNQRKSLDERVAREGANPNGTLADQYRRLNQMEGQVNESYDVIKNSKGTVDAANRVGYNKGSLEMMDNALASYYMGQDIGNAASTLAYKDFEQTIKADPYALESVKQANRLSLENAKHANRLALEQFKFDLESWQQKVDASGTEIDNIPSLEKIVSGGYDIPFNEDGTVDEEAAAEMLDATIEDIENDVVSNEKYIFDNFYNLTALEAQGEEGVGTATADMIALGDKMNDLLAQKVHGKEAFVDSDEQDNMWDYGVGMGFTSGGKAYGFTAEVNGETKWWNDMSNDEKAKYVKSPAFKNLIYQERGEQGNVLLERVYNEYLNPRMDMTNENNQVTRGHYLGQLWQDTETNRIGIETKNTILDQMGTWQAQESQNVISQIPDEHVRNLMKHYVDPETGKVRSAEEFAESYAQWAVDQGLYKGTTTMSTPGGTVTYHDMELAPLNMTDENGNPITIPGQTIQGGPGVEFSKSPDMLMPKVDSVGNIIPGQYDTIPGVSYPHAVDQYGNPMQDVAVSYESGYQKAYSEALSMYNNDRNVDLPWIGDVVNWFTSSDASYRPGLHDIYKRAWGKYANHGGGLQHLGLIGADSKATMGLRFPAVDPSKYMSAGTMNTMGFMNNAISADSENVRYAIGGPKTFLPSNSETGQAIVQQVYNDFLTMTDKKNKKRPIANVLYQDIAGSDENWTALNLKLPESYIDSYMGSKDKPGIMREHKNTLQKNGITIYLKKDAANNPFRDAVSKTDLDNLMYYKGGYDFNAYPETTQDFKMTSLPGGGVEVTGRWATTVNPQTGELVWANHSQQYLDPRTDPNKIRESYDQLLKNNSIDVLLEQSEWNNQHGVKSTNQF